MSDSNSEKFRAVWFDIPVADLERASKFYAAVLDIKVDREEYNGTAFAILEHQEGNGGCLIVNEKGICSDGGILVYMNVNNRIKDAVNLVSKHGGKVVTDTHAIGPFGFRAIVLDSEGNKIALHSSSDA